MQQLSWDNYRFILAIYRCKTIAGAARSLGVNETTVSRRLAHTEKYLHYKLFSRRSSGLIPTDSGMQLLERIESVKSQFDIFEEQVSTGKSRVSGTVRLATDTLLADHILVPEIAAFLKQHPELRLELLSSVSGDRFHDADIVLQIGTPLSSGHRISSLLGEVAFATFVTNKPDSIDSQISIPWVARRRSHTDYLETGNYSFNESNGISTLDQIVVDCAGTQVSCVRAGVGKCKLPLGVGMRDPGLKRYDPEESVQTLELWLSCQAEILSIPRGRVCKRWLEDCVSVFNRH